MNHPAFEGMHLNVPAYVKHEKLINWVAEIAALTKPDRIYWCDGSEEEYDRLCQQLVDAGTFKKLEPEQASQLLPGLLRPERRGPRGRPHLHLLAAQGRRRPHQQLDGPGRDARHACSPPVRRLHARPHDVRGAVLDGPAGLADRPHRHRAVRQPLRRREHAHHDAHGQAVYDVLGVNGEFVPCVHTVGAPLAAGQQDVTWPCNKTKYIVHYPETREIWSLRLRLRRQRAAGQEVLRAAHRLHHGPRRRAGWPSTC